VNFSVYPYYSKKAIAFKEAKQKTYAIFLKNKHFEPQRRKGHKGVLFIFLCTPLCAALAALCLCGSNISPFPHLKTYTFYAYKKKPIHHFILKR